LAAQADFGQDQMPRVTANFIIVQFHNINARSASLGLFTRERKFAQNGVLELEGNV
jgi:hypothetical protein